MKNALIALICATVLLALSETVYADPGMAKIEKATGIIAQMIAAPEEGVPQSVLQAAQGIAVIPKTIEFGFIIGQRYGKGFLVARTMNGWSNPIFVTLAGGSIGWQAGAQAADIILAFNHLPDLRSANASEFTLGADASIAAGPVGRHAGASTNLNFKTQVHSYARSQGLFLSIALKGAVLKIDHQANEAFYARRGITPSDILNENMKVPATVEKFKQALTQYVMQERK